MRPLRDLLAEPDEPAIQRTWRGIQDRRDPGRRAGWYVAAAGLAAAAVIAVIALWPSPPPRPLALEGGAALGTELAADSAARTVALADGSRVVLEPATRLAVGENTGDRMHLVLERGRADVHVEPGGPRRWAIDCGIATIEVIGTWFVVERNAERVVVTVKEGHVRVASERLAPPVAHLYAGDSLVIPVGQIARAVPVRGGDTATPAPGAAAGADPAAVAAADPAAAAAAAAAADTDTDPAAAAAAADDAATDTAAAADTATAAATAAAPAHRPAPSPSPTPSPSPSPSPSKPGPTLSWRDQVEKGDHKAAFAALGLDGLAREAEAATAVDDLVALADIARLSGHPRAAVAPLRRAAETDAVAGYSLGRLLLDQLGDPAGAAVAIESALDRGLPRSLDEPAHARVVEAHARAGHADQATRWAAIYEQGYPSGRSLDAVRRWVAR